MSDFDNNGKFAKGNRFSFANRPEARNLNGRPKGRSLQDHLRNLIDHEVTGEQLCDALVKSAIDRALKGDFRFWQEIIERIDGKVPNRIRARLVLGRRGRFASALQCEQASKVQEKGCAERQSWH